MIENIRLAFQGIWSHMMRSFLTMLGIIIGIASIIAIVSTIKGTSEQIKEDLIGAGTNTVNIYLKDGDNQYDTDSGSSGNTPTPILTDEIKEKVLELDHVVNATFYHNSSYANVYNNNNSLQGGSIYGIDTNYLATCGYVIQSGRGFVEDDYNNYHKIALLDDNAAQNLFPSENPIGQTIEISEEPYVVVGVVRQDENYQPTINSIDEYYNYYQSIVGSVMIPDSCWPISFKFDVPQNAIVKADSTDTMSTVGNAAAEVLNEAVVSNENGENKLKYQADDIMKQVRNLQKLSESTNNQLIWIASISLLVGGIGVMNIMLVSVTERTKEIGLKKAIGARKKTILGQFLTEASVLTSIGGIIGVITGIGLSKVVGKLTGSPTAISIPAIVVAVLFSTVIGVVFGLLPSVKAANLNPIDALRSE